MSREICEYIGAARGPAGNSNATPRKSGLAFSSGTKAQQAMEFLMTYGWTVLIVTAVLVTLFNMGLFSSSTFAPRAQPGNCKVLRTGGFTNLEGTCSGVPPQSVAFFNGGSSYVTLPSGSSITSFPGGAMTITAWIYPTNLVLGSSQAWEDIICEGAETSYNGYEFGLTNPVSGVLTANSLVFRYDPSSSSWSSVTTPMPGLATNVWYQVAATYNSYFVNFYINGVFVGTGAASGNIYTSTYTPIIGAYASKTTYLFGGSIANVQIYNTTLDASQIQLLYTRGIGAAPIAPQYVVGWWPLNGNPNDYSGNNNNGAPTNIVYTSSWTGGYTAP
jgi:hypothetical protein